MKNSFLILSTVMSISFGIAYVSLLYKLKKFNSTITKLFIENKELKKIILQNKNINNDPDDLIHKENFIKFLSDSRDWAFEYIEASQKTIKEVSEELKDKGLNDYSEKLMQLLPENITKD